jgi:uncharacterized membrane protein YeiB
MENKLLIILVIIVLGACGLAAVSLSQAGEQLVAVAGEQLDKPASGMDMVMRSRETAPSAPRSAVTGLLWAVAIILVVGLVIYYLSLRQKAILAKEARLKEAQILKRRNGPPRPMMQPRITDHYLPNGQSHPPNHDGGYYGQ